MIIIGHLTKSPSESIRYVMNPKKCVFLESNTGLKEQKELIQFLNHHSQLHPTLDKAISFKISAHPDDALDRIRSIKIARQIMLKLKFVYCPYVTVLHMNTDVAHIHLIVSRINFDGKLINQSLDSYSVLKPLAREIEIAYGLQKVNSFNYSSDIFLTLKEKQSVLKGFPLKKGKLRENIKNALKGSYCLDEFIIACAKQKTQVRIKRNEYNIPKGISYSYDGQNCSGTRLGNGYKISKILDKLESNSYTRYDPIEIDREAVAKILVDSFANSSNWRELNFNLSKHTLELKESTENPGGFAVLVDQELLEVRFHETALMVLRQWFENFINREREEEEYRRRCENVNGGSESANSQSKVSPKFNWHNSDSSSKKSRGM